MSQGKKSTVLLVEADISLRRLIALGLQHRGMRVIEVDAPENLALYAAQGDVDLLVFDADNGIRSNWPFLQKDARAFAPLAMLPTILLAWEDITSPSYSTTTTFVTSPNVVCMQKPFDARILHTHIDQLLTIQEEREAIDLANVEAALLAAPIRPAPTIWPIIAALGLLIAFIGMMFAFAVTLVGVFILVVALLWWTIGTPTTPRRVTVPA